MFGYGYSMSAVGNVGQYYKRPRKKELEAKKESELVSVVDKLSYLANEFRESALKRDSTIASQRAEIAKLKAWIEKLEGQRGKKRV